VADAFLVGLALLLLLLYAALRRRVLAARELDRQGCRLVVLQPNVAAAVKQHGSETVVENHFSPYPQRIVLLDPCGNEGADRFIGQNVQMISWKASQLETLLRQWRLQSASEIFGAILTTEKLIRFLAGRDDNVLRSVMHDRTALYGLLASNVLQIPHVIEVAGNYELLQRLLNFTYYFGNFHQLRAFRHVSKALSNWLLGMPLRRAARVIGRNKNNYEHAFALGADVRCLSLVRIRVSSKFFEQLGSDIVPSSRPMDCRYILYVARFSPEKRPLDSIEVFERVASEIEDVQLVMIGDGPIMPAVRRRREESRYAARIKILGALPNSDVVTWTKYAAVGLEMYSGSSLVEKMACGIPIVAYDIEWMSEVIIDGYSGYTADFLDIAGMAERCLELLNNGMVASELGRRAQVLAHKLFDRGAIIKREDDYLRKALTPKLAASLERH
jgi:glycosyltransferase involved in cell wall biosynthesis